jgi:lipopolysaccharide transport system permease protein
MDEATTHSATHRVPWAALLPPWRIGAAIYRHRSLIGQFILRDVQARYRGSFLGLFWSLLRPLAMLALYTVVFGFIFQSKLGNHPTESKLDFALALFCGLILFDFFAECLSRAPTLILNSPNYVTKVVFPLEILPVSVVGAGLVQMLVSFIPLLLVVLFVPGGIPLTVFWLPVVLVPLLLFTLGLSWLLASLGVFIRDINAVVPVILQILMFASALFYSLHRVPAELRGYLLLNPLAGIIDQARSVALWGTLPDWSYYFAVLAGSGVVLVAGYAFFMRTKRAFADVM